MNYGDLTTQVKLFIARDDLDAQIPTFINAAATSIQLVMNLKSMEHTSSFTFAVPPAGDYRGEGYKIVDPPNVPWTVIAGETVHAFKLFQNAWVYDTDGVTKLYRPKYVSKSLFERAIYTSNETLYIEYLGDLLLRTDIKLDGHPLVIARYAKELLLYPKADTRAVGKILSMDYIGFVDYLTKLPAFTDDLLTFGWKALLYGALIEAAPYLGKKDSRLDDWKALRGTAMNELLTYSVSVDAYSEAMQ